VVFPTLSSAQGAEFQRVAAAAPAGTEQVTVELAISLGGRVAPSPRRASDHTPNVGIRMTLGALQRVDSLAPLSEVATGGVEALC